MPYSRYGYRETMLNDDINYKKQFFEDRDVAQLMQYKTAILYYPNELEMENLEMVTHLWTSSSKLFNLANSYYGYPELWWVIAWFNKKPTEAHYEVGDVILIPTPLQTILSYFQRSGLNV